MSTRRNFLKGVGAAGIAVAATSVHSQADVNTDVISQRKVRIATRKSRVVVKSMTRREDTVLRYGCYGDNWHMSWAADDRQYVSLCDGAGISDPPKVLYNSRMLAISGSPREARFHDLPNYPLLGRPVQGRQDTRYYNFGTLACDGQLYQFMSTFNRSFRTDEIDKPDLNNLVRFNGAKLIYSPNNGRTWCNQDGSTPVVWEDWGRRSRQTMVFFEEDQEAFSLLTILQMGKNYESNRDGYVYVYAPNGNTEGTMNELVMFRVPKRKLLDRGSYEYFAGMGTNGPKWTKALEARGVVHRFPRGWVNKLAHPYSWQPSVVYIAALGLFLMANWGMGTSTDGTWFGKPSYLGFWVGENPWGPWTQVHEETAWLPRGDTNARAYQPQIAPKWVAADGKSFWLVWTDFQVTDEVARRRAREEHNRRVDHDIDGEAEVVRSATLMREYRPYYAFNVQRVDISVA